MMPYKHMLKAVLAVTKSIAFPCCFLYSCKIMTQNILVNSARVTLKAKRNSTSFNQKSELNNPQVWLTSGNFQIVLIQVDLCLFVAYFSDIFWYFVLAFNYITFQPNSELIFKVSSDMKDSCNVLWYCSVLTFRTQLSSSIVNASYKKSIYLWIFKEQGLLTIL